MSMNKQQQDAVLEATMRYAVGQMIAAEKQLDEAIEHFDNLSPEEMDEIRQRRKQEMIELAKQRKKWADQGRGKYEEIYDQKDYFTQIQENDRVVCHFYRPTTEHCTTLDQHLQKLAETHLEARFIKINAEKSMVLCDKLNITIMPTIVITKHSKLIDIIEGFTDLGNTAAFTTITLAKRLGKKGGLDFDEDEEKAKEFRKQMEKKQNQPNIRESQYQTARAHVLASLDDGDDDWLNDD